MARREAHRRTNGPLLPWYDGQSDTAKVKSPAFCSAACRPMVKIVRRAIGSSPSLSKSRFLGSCKTPRSVAQTAVSRVRPSGFQDRVCRAFLRHTVSLHAFSFCRHMNIPCGFALSGLVQVCS